MLQESEAPEVVCTQQDKGFINPISDNENNSHHDLPPSPKRSSLLSTLYTAFSLFLLFLTFFIAQFDKFILSYFQDSVIRSLNLSSIDYGVLSGYATSIVFALCALPAAFIADYTNSRVWVLTVAALWWSLCVLFQGLAHNFWQILLARIGMGVGQAPVEALSISLISDMVSPRWLFLCESLFYVSVYVGEAVSGQIATAFDATHTPWNTALKSIGVVGMILALFTRLVLREPVRRSAFTLQNETTADTALFDPRPAPKSGMKTKLRHARHQLRASISQVVRMRSFWLLTLSSGARQFSGNVFGWYMPSYLSSIYPNSPSLLSRYGIVVGVAGSAAVILGGLLCSTPLTPQRSTTLALLLTALGGMLSSAFVLCMIFSLTLASGNPSHGTAILYGSMTAAYLTAELWLGAFASILALLLPPRTKTFCLALYTSTIILIYSSAPEMIGLSLRRYAVGSAAYIRQTKVVLAVLIPVGYWVAGVGFLLAIRKVSMDLKGEMVPVGMVGWKRRAAFVVFVVVLGALTVALFAVSLTISGLQ